MKVPNFMKFNLKDENVKNNETENFKHAYALNHVFHLPPLILVSNN